MTKSFNACPKPDCKSENLYIGDMNKDKDCAWQGITCEQCGFEFVEVFYFSHNETKDTGVEIDEEGKPKNMELHNSRLQFWKVSGLTKFFGNFTQTNKGE
jgi:hypothetical protein